MRDRIIDLRRVPAAQLRGAPHNWRTHPGDQRDAVAGSLEELGWYDPLLVRVLDDGALELIDGHLRADIAQGVGPETVIPVIVTDLTDAEAKVANLTHDPMAGMATQDDAKLRELLAECRDMRIDDGRLQAMIDSMDDSFVSTQAAQVEAPEEFPEVDESLATEHQCPKCGYEWSGKSK